MALFVQHIIDGSEFSFLIVIKDAADASGRPLLRCSAVQLLSRVDEVHVFLFDTSPTVFLCGFEPAVRSRFICHDGWSDPLRWDDGSFSKDCTIVNLDVFGGFKTHLEHHRTAKDGKSVAVMIDSLSPVIIHKSVGYACKALHELRLTAGITQVICLLHQDTHDASAACAVSHIADTVLDMEPCRNATTLPEDPMGVCDLHVTHKRKSGKIIRLKEILTVDHNYRLHLFTDRQTTNIISRAVEPQVKSTANLTFNLNLRESERRAKDKVVLPYTKVQQRHEYRVKSGNPSEESGKIFYEPDDVDDFDEEDPDDDLEI